MTTRLVAYDFVESLQETAHETLKAYLESVKAPAEVIQLEGDIFDLNYYLSEDYGGDTSDNPLQRFDIQGIVIQTANDIAAVGGEFASPEGKIPARAGSILDSLLEKSHDAKKQEAGKQ